MKERRMDNTYMVVSLEREEEGRKGEGWREEAWVRKRGRGEASKREEG